MRVALDAAQETSLRGGFFVTAVALPARMNAQENPMFQTRDLKAAPAPIRRKPAPIKTKGR